MELRSSAYLLTGLLVTDIRRPTVSGFLRSRKLRGATMFEERRENSPIIKLRQVNSPFISIAHSRDRRPMGPQASCLLNVGIRPTPTLTHNHNPPPIQNRLRSRRTVRHLN